MKKALLFILLLSCYHISLGQIAPEKKEICDTFFYSDKSSIELLKYIENPCPNDSTCRKDIAKAKSDVENGKIKFLMPQSLGTYDVRQEDQLQQLCNTNKLIFDHELFSCLIERGQTNGCYGLYMDKIIALKLGANFRDSLLKKADTMYVATNPTVYYTKCDTLPRIFDKDIFESTEMDIPLKKDFFEKLNRSGFIPKIDIEFYIDTLGQASKYYLSQFIDGDLNENLKFKSELYNIALAHIKQFKLWKPGIILNQRVKTIYNTRFSFYVEK